jgi:hypothetical protein
MPGCTIVYIGKLIGFDTFKEKGLGKYWFKISDLTI